MLKSFLAFFLLALCPLLVAQQSLDNGAIVRLVKAGLSEGLVIATINSQTGTYDTSIDGIIALKKAGVSDKVVEAIVAKASAPAIAAATVSTAAPAVNSSGLPAGIDEVGVYVKDKSGAWVAMLPEIVNFKTGGVLKNLATAGIVKGDLNGHIAGPKAKLSGTFPVTLAVYLPEGVAISEYQLLRLHVNPDSREFRSVTGGVMHVSGGATRDAIEFQAERIAPRVFQLTLQSSIGKGEYGLLPPGAYNSSNMGSSGKLFTISVTE